MIDYIELGHGKFKVLESDIAEARAKELQEEVEAFNKASTNGIYRMIRSDFLGNKKQGFNCFNHCPNCNATDPDIEWGERVGRHGCMAKCYLS